MPGFDKDALKDAWFYFLLWIGYIKIEYKGGKDDGNKR